MLDFDLIKSILIIAIAAGIITTAVTQKIKEAIKFKSSNRIVIVSFVISMIIGTLFSLTFSDTNIVGSLWCGLFSFVGADAIYKTFEEKIFTPFSEIYKTDEVEIKKDDIIK